MGLYLHDPDSGLEVPVREIDVSASKWRPYILCAQKALRYALHGDNRGQMVEGDAQRREELVPRDMAAYHEEPCFRFVTDNNPVPVHDRVEPTLVKMEAIIHVVAEDVISIVVDDMRQAVYHSSGDYDRPGSPVDRLYPDRWKILGVRDPVRLVGFVWRWEDERF